MKGLNNIYITFILDEEINKLRWQAKLQWLARAVSRAVSGAVTARIMPA